MAGGRDGTAQGLGAPKVEPSAVAEFIDANWGRPHKSKITGQMLLDLEAKYGIKPLWAVVILGAESSFGDLTGMGGPLAEHNNFGGIKATVTGPWDKTTNGIITARDKPWWTWPDAKTGLDAWGLYLSTRYSGIYMQCLGAGDWREFAAIYYGETVDRYEEYVEGLLARVEQVRGKAAKAGIAW